MDTRALGILAALTSASSWAVGSILFKRLGESLSPLAMTLFKGGISLVLLGGALALVSGFESIPAGPLWLLVASGLIGIAVGDACFFAALQGLGPHALAVLLTLGQVLTILLAVVFLGERPALLAWGGIGLIIAGVGVVVHARIARELRGPGGDGDGQANAAAPGQRGKTLRGLGFGLLSVVAMSVSILIIKEPLEHVSALAATFVRMLAGTVGMLGFGLVTRRIGRWVTPFHDSRLLLRFLAAVCVITFGGFWLALVAIKHLEVAVANTLISAEPLFVLPLAAIFLGEPITPPAVVGTLLAIAGMTLVFYA